MKWIYKEKWPRSKKEFLLFPKYCDTCGYAFWLVFITESFHCECGGRLWTYRDDATKYKKTIKL